MGFFDFLKPKKAIYSDNQLKQIDASLDKQYEILTANDKYFYGTPELVNDGTMANQIKEFGDKIGEYLIAMDIIMQKDHAYYDIYHCCDKVATALRTPL